MNKAEILKRHRASLGMTQTQYAREIRPDMSFVTLSRWENGGEISDVYWHLICQRFPEIAEMSCDNA